MHTSPLFREPRVIKFLLTNTVVDVHPTSPPTDWMKHRTKRLQGKHRAETDNAEATEPDRPSGKETPRVPTTKVTTDATTTTEPTSDRRAQDPTTG
jgi:hypothetical protein